MRGRQLHAAVQATRPRPQRAPSSARAGRRAEDGDVLHGGTRTGGVGGCRWVSDVIGGLRTTVVWGVGGCVRVRHLPTRDDAMPPAADDLARVERKFTAAFPGGEGALGAPARATAPLCSRPPLFFACVCAAQATRAATTVSSRTP
jgi:hypothetical protein